MNYQKSFEIFYELHVYCCGNNLERQVLFISWVTKWLIFQNLEVFIVFGSCKWLFCDVEFNNLEHQMFYLGY